MAKAKLGKCQNERAAPHELARAKFLHVAASKKTPVSREVRSLPHRLSLAREEAEIPSLQLDELAGIAGGRTSRAENGKRIEGLPLDTVIKMARALGVRAAWLALGEEPMRHKLEQPAAQESLSPSTLGEDRAAFARRESKKMQQGADGGGKRKTGE